VSEQPDRSHLADVVAQRRALRESVLLRFYEESGGVAAPFGRASYQGWVTENPGVDDAVQWLVDAGFVEHIASGGLAGLTIRGVQTAEEMILPPDDPMESIDAIQLRQIEAFTTELDLGLERGEIGAEPDVLEEIRDLLQVIQIQLGARPRKGVVWASLRVVQQLLIGAGGSVAGELAMRIQPMLAAGG
jgi:hypothetical protein